MVRHSFFGVSGVVRKRFFKAPGFVWLQSKCSQDTQPGHGFRGMERMHNMTCAVPKVRVPYWYP